MATTKKQEDVEKNKDKNFKWEGKDKTGKKLEGQMKAASEAVVRVTLRGRGITIVSIKKIGIASKANKGKIKPIDIAIFTRQLSTMMKAGVPLMQSFDIVAKGSSNASITTLLLDIKSSIEQGASLSDSFAKHPEYFDRLYCNLIAAGEKAGILEMILDRLAVYKEKTEGIKKKIKSALTYPISIMAIALIVTSIIMIFVVPSFKSVFAQFGAELPMPTLIIMGISDFVVKWWYLIFGSLFGTITFLINLIKTNENASNTWDRMLLNMPIFGFIIQKSIWSRWCRTLSTMFAAGVPLVEALDSVAGSAGNHVYEVATRKVQKDVATGQGLTVSIEQLNLFPNMMIQMISIGEQSGSLDSMLDKVAEIYEEEVNNAFAGLSSLMEPLIIGFLGIVVGGLVVAMYLPIFKMAAAT